MNILGNHKLSINEKMIKRWSEAETFPYLKAVTTPTRAMLLYGSWGLRDSNLVHDQQLVLL